MALLYVKDCGIWITIRLRTLRAARLAAHNHKIAFARPYHGPK